MFGANKDLETERISGDQFLPHLNIKARYEPKKFTSMREQQVKQNHITFTLYCDAYDIFLTDKIIHGNRSFVVSSVAEYNDSWGPHMEILIREQNSRLHEIVTVKTLAEIQSNYDSILGERNGDKDFIVKEVRVLVDSAATMKESFIKMLPSGKIDTTQLIMTVDYPEEIKETDKINYKGKDYEIKWIVPFPHQTSVGLNEYIKNYDG